MRKHPQAPATARVRNLHSALRAYRQQAGNAHEIAPVLRRAEQAVRREIAALGNCRHAAGQAADESLLRAANAVLDALYEVLSKIQIWLSHLRQQVLPYVARS